jgi:hypothetical protein
MKKLVTLVGFMVLLLGSCGDSSNFTNNQDINFHNLNNFVQSCWPSYCPHPLDKNAPDTCFAAYLSCLPIDSVLYGTREWSTLPSNNSNVVSTNGAYNYRPLPPGNGDTKSESATATKEDSDWLAQSSISAKFTFGSNGSIDFTIGIKVPYTNGGACFGSVKRHLYGYKENSRWIMEVTSMLCPDYCRIFPSECL